MENEHKLSQEELELKRKIEINLAKMGGKPFTAEDEIRYKQIKAKKKRQYEAEDKTKLFSNYNADIVGVGKGQGTSKTTEEKKIIKPEEFAYLNDIVCIFPTGYQRIEKAPYYQEKVFAASSR